MKFLIVVAALLAVAAAQDARFKRNAILGYAAPGAVVRGASSVISGPSGTIVADTGSVSTGGVVAAAPAAYAAPLAYSAYSTYGAPLAYAAPAAYAAPLAYSAPAAYASPLAYSAYSGVHAGAVVAPGTTLIGPSTSGAPGTVITGY